MTTALESTPLTCRKSEDGIVSIILESADRPVVILDRDLLTRLDATLDVLTETLGSEPVAGVLLRSACPRVFVAGADLREIDGLDDQSLLEYLAFGSSVFAKLAALPCPTVACIDGATLGGGLEIAMHCDALIASTVNAKGKPYPIGLPECGLGLLPGWGGTQMLPARIDPFTAMQSTIGGTPSMSNDAPVGLLDVIVDTPDDIEAAAISWIGSHNEPTRTDGVPRCLSDKHPGAMQSALERIHAEQPETAEAEAVIDAIETGLADGYQAALLAEQRNLVALRSTEHTRAQLDAFFAKQG